MISGERSHCYAAFAEFHNFIFLLLLVDRFNCDDTDENADVSAQGMIIGNSQKDSRRVRLSLMRYMNLAWILLMRNISEQIANRFRTAENQGEEEKNVREILTNINRDKREHHKHWIVQILLITVISFVC